MMNHMFFWIVISILVIDSRSAENGINWNGNYWANGCDFLGQDLSNVVISSELCWRQCTVTQECTHFTWTTWNGGTCWMKKGTAFKKDALPTNNQTMVCGLRDPDPFDTSTSTNKPITLPNPYPNTYPFNPYPPNNYPNSDSWLRWLLGILTVIIVGGGIGLTCGANWARNGCQCKIAKWQGNTNTKNRGPNAEGQGTPLVLNQLPAI